MDKEKENTKKLLELLYNEVEKNTPILIEKWVNKTFWSLCQNPLSKNLVVNKRNLAIALENLESKLLLNYVNKCNIDGDNKEFFDDKYALKLYVIVYYFFSERKEDLSIEVIYEKIDLIIKLFNESLELNNFFDKLKL